MSGELSADGYKIDGPSQRMLRALRGGDWHYSSTLRDAAELDDNRQVSYRMEHHLGPAGLVLEAVREEPEKEARRFKLSDEGEAWVEAHADELLAPTTREEIADHAQQGYTEGTEAKDSVQGYRKKLSRYKNQVDEVREQIGHVQDDHDQYFRRVRSVEKESEDSRERSKEAKQAVGELREAVGARATTETVGELQDDVSHLQRRQSVTEHRQVGLARQQAETERSRAELRALAKPAGYVAAGSVVAYLALLVVVYLLVPGLVASAVIAGIVVVLGIGFAGGAALYARGVRSLLAPMMDQGDDVRAPTE
jgi:hypothetical protein